MNAIISHGFARKAIIACLFSTLLCGAASAAGTATNSQPRLVIVKAIYGDPTDASATIDVTKQIAAAVKDNAVTLRVGNDSFDDPASGVNKVLKLDYTIDGVPGTKLVYENALLRLSLKDKPDPAQKSSRLIIRKAIYGDIPDGGQNDVTAQVAAIVQNDSLTVKADDDNFGDPSGGSMKKLKVDYTFDGKAKTKTVAQDETLTISANGD